MLKKQGLSQIVSEARVCNTRDKMAEEMVDM